MIFDSHAHLIADDDNRYPPAPLTGKLREGALAVRFTAETLLRLMDDAGVESICAVQRAHIYGYDNRYVIDCARRYSDRMRAIVAIDANSPTATDDIRRWVDQGAVAIRFAALNADVQDTDWFASVAALDAWAAVESLGVAVCLHVFRPLREKMLAALSPLLDRFSRVNVIVEHMSNAALELGAPAYGVDDALLALKLRPNVFFKFTTINLHRMAEAGSPASPMLNYLVGQFGADRIMWGSDLGQSKGSYAEMVALLKESAQDLREVDRAAIFGQTCQTAFTARAVESSLAGSARGV
jgi:predicted TIM-barrel fold metal-dependent hydrolase